MADKKTNIIDTDDLLVVIKFLSKNILILLVIPILVGIGAYIYAHRLPDEYGAKTQILLGSSTGTEYQSQIYRNLTGYGSGVSQITNQIRVLQSHDLISRTLEKLDFQVSYYIVGRVKTTEIPNIDAFDVDIKLVESEGALFGVPFDVRILSKEEFVLIFEKNGEQIERKHKFNEDIIESDYLLRLDRNSLLSDETFEQLKSNDYRFVVKSKKFLISKYKSNLRIGNEENTSILVISMRDELELKAKSFLDSLSETYIDYTIQSQIDLNKNTLDYIDRQLSGITGILDSIETNLETYKEQQDILDLSREQAQFFEKLLGFESEKRQINMKLESLESLENYLISSKENTKILPPALYITEDDFLQGSLRELYNLEVQKSQATFDYKEGSPGSDRAAET
ncbi:MAG: Wzz/FepE/Etk N-terminal domain-containing protein, partial [Cryomorphaceae bacterium]